MKTSSAVKKLEKAGYEVKSNLNSYIATKDDVTISFFSQNEKCSKFTFDSKGSCAKTFGLSLTQAMSF